MHHPSIDQAAGVGPVAVLVAPRSLRPSREPPAIITTGQLGIEFRSVALDRFHDLQVDQVAMLDRWPVWFALRAAAPRPST